MYSIEKHNLQIFEQIEKLNSIIKQDEEYLYYIRTEYDVVTDQYMNGDIRRPIGKYQARLMREAGRVQKRIENNKNKIMKLQMKTI